MKEVKAFVHRARIGDIVHALEEAGFRHLSVVDVKGLLRALNDQEQSYSIEIGERVINEVKLVILFALVRHACSYRSSPRSRPRSSCCSICCVIF